MSTIRTIIDRVNENKPNVLSQATLVAWLAELDGKIAMDIFLMDMVELPQFQYDPEADLDRELLVKFPHDDIYYYWLCAKIDAENGEYNKYQNTMQLYNASYSNFVQWFLTVYEPAQGGCCRRHNVTHYISAYGLAVQQGFQGTLDEWLVSLGGKQGIQGIQGIPGEPGAAGKDGYTPKKGVDYYTPEEQQALLANVLGSEQITQMEKDLADIKADLAYVPIDITGITCLQAKVHEMGTTIQEVSISWALNKIPVKQTMNSELLEEDDRQQTYSNLSITQNKTYTLVVTDERENTDSASVSITFLNGVYYGALDVSESYEDFSDMILQLTRKLQSSKALTFTADAGATERLAFAIPSRYGTPTFTVGGFEGGFSKLLTEEFTNASGYTEDYDLWVSDNLGLGSTTVVVK